MKRSHSKRTYPAKKSIPKELFKKIILSNGKVIFECTPTQRKQEKHEHIRRSRRFLKQSQQWEMSENEL